MSTQTVEEVATINGHARSLAVFNGRLYWTSKPSLDSYSTGGEVSSMQLPHGPVVVLTMAEDPIGLGVTAKRVVWAEFESGLKTVTHANGVAAGAAESFGGKLNAAGVWIDGDTLFWSQMNGDNSIRKRSIQHEGTEVLLACHQRWPVSIMGDAKRLYWVDWYFGVDEGKIVAMDRSGGHPRVLADGRHKPGPGSIAGNADTLFWVEDGSRLMRMAK